MPIHVPEQVFQHRSLHAWNEAAAVLRLKETGTAEFFEFLLAHSPWRVGLDQCAICAAFLPRVRQGYGTREAARRPHLPGIKCE
jgi:hypothetical protein